MLGSSNFQPRCECGLDACIYTGLYRAITWDGLQSYQKMERFQQVDISYLFHIASPPIIRVPLMDIPQRTVACNQELLEVYQLRNAIAIQSPRLDWS